MRKVDQKNSKKRAKWLKKKEDRITKIVNIINNTRLSGSRKQKEYKPYNMLDDPKLKGLIEETSNC